MHKNVDNLIVIENLLKKKTYSEKIPKIIAVSKTFPLSDIMPLIKYGQIDFGENKIQEALDKWIIIKKEFPNIKLHMIGKLQSNKAKNAVQLFDVIHSLDNQKLADVLSKNEKNLNKKINYFIQVNVGQEVQKSGIPYNLVDQFYDYCSKELNLNILGLMAIPPADDNEDKHFKLLNETNTSLGLNELSMGMSSDYQIALKHKATFLRIGSAIFGNRS